VTPVQTHRQKIYKLHCISQNNKLYYIIRVFWATCFDSYRVIFGPFKNYIQDKMSLKMHCGTPNAYIM